MGWGGGGQKEHNNQQEIDSERSLRFSNNVFWPDFACTNLYTHNTLYLITNDKESNVKITVNLSVSLLRTHMCYFVLR